MWESQCDRNQAKKETRDVWKDYYDKHFSDKDGPKNCNLRIEDDGVVCYAYFFKNSQMSGMVWLYIWASAPDALPNRPRGLPQLNTKSCIRDNEFMPPSSVTPDLDNFQAIFDIRDGLQECAVYFRGQLLAVVGENTFPGWSMNSIVDNELASALLET